MSDTEKWIITGFFTVLFTLIGVIWNMLVSSVKEQKESCERQQHDMLGKFNDHREKVAETYIRKDVTDRLFIAVETLGNDVKQILTRLGDKY